MQIHCLRTQEDLFETRLLRRVFDPVFVDAENVDSNLGAPLLLYGQWHPQGFRAGLQWLSGLAYRLRYPCIVLPPFESGSLSSVLSLHTQLNVQMVNTNHLTILPEAELLQLGEKQAFKIQTDAAFSGLTGKLCLAAGEPSLAGLLLIQPKNTSTPLLLCGARLLSASGLSDDEDRLFLFERIVTWAWGWQSIPDLSQKTAIVSVQLDDSTWHVVCIVLAGCRLTAPKEIVALGRTLFGCEISHSDLEIALRRLAELGLATFDGDNLQVNLEGVEVYTQQNGLWAYVRSLRKDFERMQP